MRLPILQLIGSLETCPLRGLTNDYDQPSDTYSNWSTTSMLSNRGGELCTSDVGFDKAAPELDPERVSKSDS
jgi:hypothetical protein